MDVLLPFLYLNSKILGVDKNNLDPPALAAIPRLEKSNYSFTSLHFHLHFLESS